MARLAFATPLLILSILAGPARAAERVYPEARHGTGELKYVNDIPVFVASGSPEQIGEAYGVLVGKPAHRLLDSAPKFVAQMNLTPMYGMIVRSGGTLIRRMPKEYDAELAAASAASGVDRGLLTFGNTMPDFYKLAGCSTLIVERPRSKTGGPIFGRNFDWPPFDGFPEHSLVTVLKPEGKRTFASVAMPPVLGVFSGINDAGLTLTMNEIFHAADGSPQFDAEGLPRLYIYRRVLEECATLAEAEKLLRSLKPSTSASLTVCDTEGGAVFEVTPNSFSVRRAENAICVCTNHFQCEGLSTPGVCLRLGNLLKSQKLDGELGVSEVYAELKGVNQGEWTMHSMVFEPAALKMHLAISRDRKSATNFELTELDLAALFAK